MKFDKKYISGQFTLVIILALLFCVGIVVFMVKTMTVDKKKWEEIRRDNFEKDSLIVEPKRGNILSADGQLMASDLPDYKVYIDFKSGLSKLATKNNVFDHNDSVLYNTKDSLFLGKGEKYANILDTICEGLSRICPPKTPAEYRTHLAEGWKSQSRYYEVCKHNTLNYIQYKEQMALGLME